MKSRLAAIQKPRQRNTQRSRGNSSASDTPSAIAVVAWPEGKLAQLASPDQKSNDTLPVSGKYLGRARPIAYLARLAMIPELATDANT